MAAEKAAGFDPAIRVFVSGEQAEVTGAILMDRLGPFAEEGAAAPATAGAASIPAQFVVLTFYPEEAGLPSASVDEVAALVPPECGVVRIESTEVSRDWVDGWRDHFHPVVIGRVRVRPPWEAPDCEAGVDVVINPGLGFGTGLHPTTRGTLELLQSHDPANASIDCKVGGGGHRLVDAGTGSGILSIAAAKLGWGPILAFDNDPVALVAARDNVEVNGVGSEIDLRLAGVDDADLVWFAGRTVLANMTLEPVSVLLGRFAAASGGASRVEGGISSCVPVRIVVSGILAGGQERDVLERAAEAGFVCGRAIYGAEWVSMELLPTLSVGR
jgi:ribosomal protein L11 methylase PrmA